MIDPRSVDCTITGNCRSRCRSGPRSVLMVRAASSLDGRVKLGDHGTTRDGEKPLVASSSVGCQCIAAFTCRLTLPCPNGQSLVDQRRLKLIPEPSACWRGDRAIV